MPAETPPADGDLRDRYAEALRHEGGDLNDDRELYELADAVLAVRDDEVERLREDDRIAQEAIDDTLWRMHQLRSWAYRELSGETKHNVLAVITNVWDCLDPDRTRGPLNAPETAPQTPARRCPSCDHLTSHHQPEGCWYGITTSTPGSDLVCPCSVSLAALDAPSGADRPANDAEKRLDQLRAYARWCKDRSVEPEDREILAIADGSGSNDYVTLMGGADSPAETRTGDPGQNGVPQAATEAQEG